MLPTRPPAELITVTSWAVVASHSGDSSWRGSSLVVAAIAITAALAGATAIGAAVN